MLHARYFALAALLNCAEAFGQGQVSFANDQTAPVYCDFVGGQRVPRGRAFEVELMFAPDGTPAEAFDSVAVRLGAPTFFNAPPDGVFLGGVRTMPFVGFGLFQVRVWESAYGVDYLSTIASGDPRAHAGKSVIMRIFARESFPTPPENPSRLVEFGFTSFSINNLGLAGQCVPEPSTYALALLGGGALWLLRRRNNL